MRYTPKIELVDPSTLPISKIRIRDLVIEVTRRCNMHCDHCMRGEPQELDIMPRIIDEIFLQEVGFQGVTFAGGEPTLNVAAITQFADRIEARGIGGNDGFTSFYLVTNGVIVSAEMADALAVLYKRIDWYYTDVDEFYGGLCISQDQYHIGSRVDYPPEYRLYTFFKPTERKERIRPTGILNAGRAKDNGIGNPNKIEHVDEWEIEVTAENGSGVVDIFTTVYIAANGNVLPGCNFSYDFIDTHAIGNILQEPLAGILLRDMEKKGIDLV